jgi:DNA-binding CsgD family transcriptional regulator
MLDAGKGASRVALELGLSEHTVRGHIKEILKAFGVGSQLEALARARELGILDGD